jgi:hypothetical protein
VALMCVMSSILTWLSPVPTTELININNHVYSCMPRVFPTTSSPPEAAQEGH